MHRTEKIGMAVALVVIASLIALIYLAAAPAHPARAAGQSIGCDDSGKFLPTSASTTNNYQSPCGPSATTTPIFLAAASGTATTTILSAYIPMAQAFDINLFNYATTSQSSVVNFTVWFSNNGVDWYQQGAQAVVSGANTVSAESYVWTPGATSTTRLYPTTSVRVSSSGEKYVQVRASASAATTSVYAQLILDNAVPN